jgi:hypothetical protein
MEGSKDDVELESMLTDEGLMWDIILNASRSQYFKTFFLRYWWSGEKASVFLSQAEKVCLGQTREY